MSPSCCWRTNTMWGAACEIRIFETYRLIYFQGKINIVCVHLFILLKLSDLKRSVVDIHYEQMIRHKFWNDLFWCITRITLIHHNYVDNIIFAMYTILFYCNDFFCLPKSFITFILLFLTYIIGILYLNATAADH